MHKNSRLLTIVIFLLLTGSGCAGGLENRLVFPGSPYPQGDWKQCEKAKFEEVRFSSADKTVLHGWYAECKKPRAYVLYCHGNGGNITHRAGLLRKLRDEMQLSVFIFDYRGYGKSQGKPDEKGVLADARAARAWLAKKAGVPAKEIVLMGRSLGGAVAVDLTTDISPRGLILESTFTRLPDVAEKMLPLVPARWLMGNRLDSLAKIGKYHGPLLQSHSKTDEVIPYELGKKLFDAAKANPKQFVVLDHRSHNDSQPAEYYKTLSQFIDKLPSKSAADSSAE